MTLESDISIKLQEIRTRIDAVDDEILALMNKRALAAKEIAKLKLGRTADALFYRPEREAQVLRRIKASNAVTCGPLKNETVALLFRELMSACLALEQPLRVAFLGPPGTFSQTAAIKHFGHAVETVPLATISDVFRDVESGLCHYGVVPVENSTEGVITNTLDMFMQSSLRICGEVSLRIHQYLLGRKVIFDQIKRVYSHPQSLAQCRRWLDRNLPHATQLALVSNGEAARRVAEGSPEDVAIAGETAAEIYGLDILASHIEDGSSNTTRFLVIGNYDSLSSDRDKTSLLIACRNEAGGLYSLLTPFAMQDINMTRIESRPSKNNLWEYVFFIDFEGHRDDPKVQQAFSLLKQKASLFKILGSYPMAEL